MAKYDGDAIDTLYKIVLDQHSVRTIILNYADFLAGFAASWPLLLGGNTMWTVGLVATLISFSSIIAADTFAFIGGKVLFFFFFWCTWTICTILIQVFLGKIYGLDVISCRLLAGHRLPQSVQKRHGREHLLG